MSGNELFLKLLGRASVFTRAPRKEIAEVRVSGLVDPEWYLDVYEDVRKARKDPCKHLCTFGWKEERSPNRYFDVAFYKAQLVS